MARAESLSHVYPTVGASFEDIFGLDLLTELSIYGKIDRGMDLPHNISALTKLKVLVFLTTSKPCQLRWHIL
jgi:hypothetical protein